MEKKQIKTGVFAENRRATFDYEILETLEAGLVLLGPEVKSIQNSRVMIAGSQILVRGGSAYLVGADIPPYQPANQEEYDQNRPRQLLLHKNEIEKLLESLHQKLTIVPLKVYNKGSRIKLAFGIARRRKKSDKREVLKKKADVREMRRER
jgi:SsrA-binding protein